VKKIVLFLFKRSTVEGMSALLRKKEDGTYGATFSHVPDAPIPLKDQKAFTRNTLRGFIDLLLEPRVVSSLLKDDRKMFLLDTQRVGTVVTEFYAAVLEEIQVSDALAHQLDSDFFPLSAVPQATPIVCFKHGEKPDVSEGIHMSEGIHAALLRGYDAFTPKREPAPVA